MATALWEDFTDKFGFNDGSTSENRDYKIRDTICQLLNETPEFKDAKVKAWPYDGGGMHNNCYIILLPVQPKGHGLEQYIRGKVKEIDRKNEPDLDYDEIVQEAYAMEEED